MFLEIFEQPQYLDPQYMETVAIEFSLKNEKRISSGSGSEKVFFQSPTNDLVITKEKNGWFSVFHLEPIKSEVADRYLYKILKRGSLQREDFAKIFKQSLNDEKQHFFRRG